MPDPIPSACPFDGYASPLLQLSGHTNEGLPIYRVQCPVCRNYTIGQSSKQGAVDAWGARATPTYATWLASAAAATAADTAAMKAWIVAHPPVAD